VFSFAVYKVEQMNTITTKQYLPLSIEKAWDFFSNPRNLNLITPHYMRFKILNENLPEKIYPGLVVQYTVSPVMGIPMGWVTLITHSSEKEMFIDSQISGPYRIWHHQHHFRATGSGVEMTDILHYQLYGGVFGKLLNALFVARKVKSIFDYRKQKLEELFPIK